MPTSTIPYDPSLVLGMIVDTDKITQLEAIAEKQKPANAARDKFNALLRQKLSLDMTKRELISLGAGPKQIEPLQKQIDKLMSDVVKASTDLANAVIKTETAIADLTTKQGQKQVSMQVQSTLDFAASQHRACR